MINGQVILEEEYDENYEPTEQGDVILRAVTARDQLDCAYLTCIPKTLRTINYILGTKLYFVWDHCSLHQLWKKSASCMYMSELTAGLQRYKYNTRFYAVIVFNKFIDRFQFTYSSECIHYHCHTIFTALILGNLSDFFFT